MIAWTKLTTVRAFLFPQIMVTFFQCLQEYLKTDDAYQFGKKDIKRISQYCKSIYDSYDNQSITYTQSIEGENTFEVRNYPDSFKKTIVGILTSVGRKKKENILNQKPVEVEPVKKDRKRIAIKKPAYSFKPSL